MKEKLGIIKGAGKAFFCLQRPFTKKLIIILTLRHFPKEDILWTANNAGKQLALVLKMYEAVLKI